MYPDLNEKKPGLKDLEESNELLDKPEFGRSFRLTGVSIFGSGVAVTVGGCGKTFDRLPCPTAIVDTDVSTTRIKQNLFFIDGDGKSARLYKKNRNCLWCG